MKQINLINRFFAIIFAIAFLITFSNVNLNSQCCKKGGKMDHSKCTDHSAKNNDKVDSTIIRTGKIDVNSIDVNKDGFVYQCPMDWNVISDESASCPICNMDLNKYKIKDAIMNLKNNNFDVKE